MGFGDDLMITATAAKVKKKYPESQIVIGNIKKKLITQLCMIIIQIYQIVEN